MKRATPRQNSPNDSKLRICIDQCTTNNWLHFQIDGVHIGPAVTSLVSPAMSVSCLAQSVQSFQTKLEGESYCNYDSSTRKGAISSSERIRTGQNSRSPGRRFIIPWHCCSYRACCYDSYACGTSGEKRVVRRDEQVLHHVMLPQHGMIAILSACPWRTVQLHPQCWVDVGVPRRRLLRAGLVARMPLHRLPLSRDHQRLRLQWALERRHWRAEWRNVVFSVESRFNMSWPHTCSTLRSWTQSESLHSSVV